MQELQYLKQVTAIPPIVVDATTATVVTVIDTAGYDDMVVYFNFGVLGANLTAAKLTESAVTGSGYADTVGGALPDLTSATNSDKVSEMYVNLRGHNQFFKPVVTTGGASDVLSITAILFNKNGVLPSDAPSRNVAQYVYVASVAL